MSQDDLREAIDRAKDRVPIGLYDCGTVAQYFGLEPLVKLAEQVFEAGEELPERKKVYTEDDIIFNNALDLCLPILAKKNTRIRELEEKLKEAK